MRTAIHVDDPKTVGPADIEDEDPLEFAHFDDLKTVGRPDLTWTWRRLATGMRCIALEILLTIIE
jgi:hypothetical protein